MIYTSQDWFYSVQPVQSFKVDMLKLIFNRPQTIYNNFFFQDTGTFYQSNNRKQRPKDFV